jgi:hypothetical protein
MRVPSCGAAGALRVKLLLRATHAHDAAAVHVRRSCLQVCLSPAFYAVFPLYSRNVCARCRGIKVAHNAELKLKFDT